MAKPVQPTFVSAALIQKEAVSSVTKLDPEKEEGILIATDLAKPKRGKGGLVPFVRIRIGVEAAHKAKFEAGMRVDLLIDAVNGMGLIQRLPPDVEEGWLLAPLKRNADGDSPLQLRFTWHRRQPSIAEPKLATEVQVTDSGIQFKFPEGTSFGDLAAVKKEEKPAHPMRRATDMVGMHQ
jgi:hypothetical protein